MTERNVRTTVESNMGTIVYLVEKLGFPIVICGLLIYFGFILIKRVEYKTDRAIRNTRAIMQKLEIPIIVGDDKWED